MGGIGGGCWLAPPPPLRMVLPTNLSLNPMASGGTDDRKGRWNHRQDEWCNVEKLKKPEADREGGRLWAASRILAKNVVGGAKAGGLQYLTFFAVD